MLLYWEQILQMSLQLQVPKKKGYCIQPLTLVLTGEKFSLIATLTPKMGHNASLLDTQH